MLGTMVQVFTGADIHDGVRLHRGKALVVDDTHVSIIALAGRPRDADVIALENGIIAPGFVDLQVNGGGGLMFNDAQTVAALEQIAHAHRRLGTAAFLPTLISDTPKRVQAAIEAVEAAIAKEVPGIVGLHLEGPHLAPSRKGAHDAQHLRMMEAADLALLVEAAARLPNLMVTVAPEMVTLAQIRALAQAGVIVSLGHSDADYDTAMAAFEAGACCVTHLYNAMSQMTSRAPGLVGAALAREDVFAGLIADGVHVHPAMMQLVLAQKARMFVVTDAMAVAGSDKSAFALNGRQVQRADGRLTLEDGTLAGADLTLPRAVQVLVQNCGQDIETAIARATSLPAQLLNVRGDLGGLNAGPQTLLHIDLDRGVCAPLIRA
jgi:N-acetylglucosamine-6-phosphate deacetylase